MLRKGTVDELKSGAISREAGHICVCMCHYPRGVAKALMDEYLKPLAPSAKLLKEFHDAREKLGNHNAAFQSIRYDEKFSLTAEAVEHLRRLSELSKEKDVFLVCQCGQDQRCHRELLLIAAKRWFGAKTELRKFSYPGFERRLGDEPGELRSSS
jgi:uncharacterized protein YeaO (DUF488 family)